MTTLPLLPHHLAPTKPPGHPSPSSSKINPFARPKPNHQPSSFTRTTLLPSSSLSSPSTSKIGLITPQEKVTTQTDVGSASRGKTGWRLLWRGGLEIGTEGYRLDGVTFFANLTFPSTPSSSTPRPNPFDELPVPTASGSPFALPATDTTTDLCLSLESMRGRKFLQVRGIIDLKDEELVEGGEDEVVQMSVAPDAILLAGYISGLLCRDAKLSPTGKTLTALHIGLGDEGMEPHQNTSIIVYGQLQPLTSASDGPQTLRLCVGRRRPPLQPNQEKKVRPGEPLPRAPLFFPSKAPIKAPPPFPQRHTFPQSRTLLRAPSTSSIYHPPPPTLPHSHSTQAVSHARVPPAPPPAPISGRTPGRRGEKRPRPEGQDDSDRRRRVDKIVLDKSDKRNMGEIGTSREGSVKAGLKTEPKGAAADEDIFGKTSGSISNQTHNLNGHDKTMTGTIRREALLDNLDLGDLSTGGNDSTGPSSGKGKRARVPQQILDNKASIRKQTLLMLEDRGYARTHETFKEVFSMTTKGVYFAFRNRLESGPLLKVDVQGMVRGHLIMYLPEPWIAGEKDAIDIKAEEDEELVEHIKSGEGLVRVDSAGGLEDIKEEDEDDDVLVKYEEIREEVSGRSYESVGGVG